MLTISAPDLRCRTGQVFCAAGVPEAIAQRVAYSLVEANLTGHDSHGVIRVPAYIRAVQLGRIRPQGEIAIIQERATTAVLDCGYNFGQVGAERGMRLAMAKSQEHDLAMVVLERCNHIGRLGEYVVMAAQEGLMGMVFCNGTAPGGIVAPYGGIGRALGSNPIAWGVPGRDGKAIFMDYATSVCAQGKIQVAADKEEALPEGWLLDKNGQPSCNPHDQFDGGVMLPFGGHKGYALSVLIELLAGGLSGAGPALSPDYARVQGVVLMVLNIEVFQPLPDFRGMASQSADSLKRTPCAPDCQEVLLPSEPEWCSKEIREREGIPLPDKTWERIGETATELGLDWS